MTGAEVLSEFNRNVFKTYSTFYNNVKMNALFKRAIVLAMETKYEKLLDQEDYDNLIQVIRLDKVFIPNSNLINTAPVDILTITHPGDFLVTTRIPHNVIVGDDATLANIAGFTIPVNGMQVVLTTPTSTTFTFSAAFGGGAHTVNTGQITALTLGGVSKMAGDYNHLLAIKTRYEELLPSNVSDITNTQPVTIVLNTINNNIVSGERIKIAGVLKNTNANGDRYVKKINRKTFGLYEDADLTIPVSGNGVYEGLPVIKRVHYDYAEPLISIEKISKYDQPSVSRTFFERGDSVIKVSPATPVCVEITMDYISDAILFIDVVNTVIDLESTYPIDFLYYVIDRAVQIYAAEVNAINKYQTSTVSIKAGE